MRKAIDRIVAGSVVGIGLVGGVAYAVTDPIHFQSGAPIVAEDFNTNFDQLTGAIAALEKRVDELNQQVSSLDSDVIDAQSVAGYLTTPGGKSVPFFRKVLSVSSRTATSVTLSHGIAGQPATERRFINCAVLTNHEPGRQNINLNEPEGASAAHWCDFSDTEIEITWTTTSGFPYFVVVDYVLEPLD